MLNTKKIFLPAASLCLLFLSSSAQNYNFRSYSLEDGLSQSEVNCIFEDSRGYLWMGTAGGGLNRFDGIHFTSYEEDDGLSGQIVSAITEDKKGNLWIGTTWGGISEFNGSTFAALSVKEGLLSNNITALTFDNKQQLMIGTAEGLSIYDPSSNIKGEKKNTAFYERQKNICTDKSKMLYARQTWKCAGGL